MTKYPARVPATLLNALCVLCTVTLGAGQAQAVVGGQPSAEPWVVQVVHVKENSKKLCTGVAIDERTVVTAKHCTTDVVSFADYTAVVASREDMAGIDVTLLTLQAPYRISSYPTLGPDFVGNRRALAKNTTGIAYGHTATYPGAQKSLNVYVEGHDLFNADGEAILMDSSQGELVLGDSGGPLIVQGVLVGIFNGRLKSADGSVRFVFRGLSRSLPRIQAHLQQTRARAAVASSDL